MAKLSGSRGGNIDKAEPPQKGQRFIFDEHRDAPRGFGIRITSAGGKAYILKYTSPVLGTERRMTIGQCSDWPLESARTEARALRQQIDQGVDPLEEKHKNRSTPLITTLIPDYLESRVSGLASEKAVKGYFDRDILPALGKYKAPDVKRRDIIRMVETKAKDAPTAARHLLTYTKGLFDWLIDMEYIEASPAASIKPKSIAAGGKKNVLKKIDRERVLDHSEIKAFWDLAEEVGMLKITALALKLVLVTGQRPGEVAGIHENEIEGDVWTIPASRRLKTEKDQRVPLTPLAHEIIQQARDELERLQIRRKKARNGQIFEIRAGLTLAVGGMSKAVNRYQKQLKNKDNPTWGHWTPHDLRRTCRTGISACGFSDEIGEKVIGHQKKGILKTYNQYDYDAEKLAALEGWERRLRLIISGKEPSQSNVISMSRGRA